MILDDRIQIAYNLHAVVKSESLYFRASVDLRAAAEEFAAGKVMTLSSALSVLVERGLEAEAGEQSVQVLEARARELSETVARQQVALAEARGTVAVLQERDQRWMTLFRSLEGHLRSAMAGRCVACQRPVTVYDVAVRHQCGNPSCNEPTDQILRATETSPALAAVAGALGGLLLGLAAAQSGSTG
jgi:hypothetical protein